MLTFRHTRMAAYAGYVTQSIVNLLPTLLFVTFHRTLDISYERITLLLTVNFLVQLTVDMVSARLVERVGWRISVVAAHVLCACGLAGFAVFPFLLPDAYAGLILATVVAAGGSGLIEVLVSPIVEACPAENNTADMSLLHSFYCWGCVFVVLLTTGYFLLFGTSAWRFLPLIFALIPFLNAFFFALVPINALTEKGESTPLRVLFKEKTFWLFLLLMVAAGAAENAMSPWASTFAEAGLHVSKTVGDLAGPCCFSILMGIARVLFAKFSARVDLRRALIISGALCVGAYLLASLSPLPALSLLGCGVCGFGVGILWPGVYSLASMRYPKGGAGLFAMLALAGDTGCSVGPTLVGLASASHGDSLHFGLLLAVVFPALLIVCAILLKRSHSS